MALSVRTFVAEHSLFSVRVDCKLLIVFDIAYDFVELHKLVRRGISVHIRFCLVDINIVTVRAEAVVRDKLVVLNGYVNAFLSAFVRFVFLKFGESCRRVLNPFNSSVSGCRTRKVKDVDVGCRRVSAGVSAVRLTAARTVSAVVSAVAARNKRGGHAKCHCSA